MFFEIIKKKKQFTPSQHFIIDIIIQLYVIIQTFFKVNCFEKDRKENLE